MNEWFAWMIGIDLFGWFRSSPSSRPSVRSDEQKHDVKEEPALLARNNISGSYIEQGSYLDSSYLDGSGQ